MGLLADQATGQLPVTSVAIGFLSAHCPEFGGVDAFEAHYRARDDDGVAVDNASRPGNDQLGGPSGGSCGRRWQCQRRECFEGTSVNDPVALCGLDRRHLILERRQHLHLVISVATHRRRRRGAAALRARPSRARALAHRASGAESLSVDRFHADRRAARQLRNVRATGRCCRYLRVKRERHRTSVPAIEIGKFVGQLVADNHLLGPKLEARIRLPAG